MKKTFLVTGAVAIGWLLILASTTFAGNTQNSFPAQGRGMGQWTMNSANSQYATYGTHILRTVTNTAKGVEISLTTTDPATLEHIKTMYAQDKAKTPRNTSIAMERTELSNGMKLTITGADENTVKLIQEKANAAKSGAFGNAGQGKNGIGQGKWQGKWRGLNR